MSIFAARLTPAFLTAITSIALVFLACSEGHDGSVVLLDDSTASTVRGGIDVCDSKLVATDCIDSSNCRAFDNAADCVDPEKGGNITCYECLGSGYNDECEPVLVIEGPEVTVIGGPATVICESSGQAPEGCGDLLLGLRDKGCIWAGGRCVCDMVEPTDSQCPVNYVVFNTHCIPPI